MVSIAPSGVPRRVSWRLVRRGIAILVLVAAAGCGDSGSPPTPATTTAPATAATVTAPGIEALEIAYADAVSGVSDPELASLLETLRDNTIAFADVAVAEAAGYERSPNGCEGGAGVHYVNRDLIDDESGTGLPEAIMYAEEASGLRLVGVEYFIPGNRLDPRPDILGFATNGPLYIPSVGSIYWLHVWLYDKPFDGLFAWFNYNVGCQ